MTLIFIFYLSYIGVTLSPLASVIFCPAHFFFYFELRPLYPLLSILNQISNYAVGIVNVIAYFIMFTTLFIKGTLTFKNNNEIRMTVQAAVVSVFELAFFVYWEYGPFGGLSNFWRRALDGYSMIIYYDVLILPYVILNRSVKAEMKSLFRKRSVSISPLVKLSSGQEKAFQRRSV